MTRDEVVKGLERAVGVAVGQWGEACDMCSVLRAAIALLTPPPTEEIAAVRVCVEQWPPFVGHWAVKTLLRALDALAREHEVKQMFQAAMDDKVANEDRIAALEDEKQVSDEALVLALVEHQEFRARIAVLEAKLARVQAVLTAFDGVDPTHMQHGSNYWMMRLRAALADAPEVKP